ncbi:hypothetical protein [Niallia oryzisoli]|uniref:hypothetical protein n=1 Tax=Niallia oryzisoli TaxID=1737571 RepID=UPI003734CA27
MDKAVILGTYEFIGFHLCLSLLEKGVEVTGVHLSSSSDDDYLEEKRFSVGRNSNFIEKDEAAFELERTVSDNTVLFIDYYSYYRKHKENELQSILKQTLVDNNVHCIIFLPVQYCNKQVAGEFPLQLVKNQKHYQIYYLPTIYGPWQPLHFAFQQAIHDPDKPVMIDEREWINDALFIFDVVYHIMNHLEEKENKEILLKSAINDHWKKAASLLLKQTSIENTNEEVKVSQDMIVVDVEGTLIPEGIDMQSRHLAKLKQIK